MSNLNELLEELATLRNYLDDEEAKLKPLKDAIDKVGAAVLAAMNEAGVKSARTAAGHGIAMVQKFSPRVTDREAFFRFVFDNRDASFLQSRVNLDPIMQYHDEHEGDLPPGVEVQSILSLRFNRAK